MYNYMYFYVQLFPCAEIIFPYKKLLNCKYCIHDNIHCIKSEKRRKMKCTEIREHYNQDTCRKTFQYCWYLAGGKKSDLLFKIYRSRGYS